MANLTPERVEEIRAAAREHARGWVKLPAYGDAVVEVCDALDAERAEVERLHAALQVCEHAVHLLVPSPAQAHAAQQASGAWCADWRPEDVRDDLPDFVYVPGDQRG